MKIKGMFVLAGAVVLVGLSCAARANSPGETPNPNCGNDNVVIELYHGNAAGDKVNSCASMPGRLPANGPGFCLAGAESDVVPLSSNEPEGDTCGSLQANLPQGYNISLGYSQPVKQLTLTFTVWQWYYNASNKLVFKQVAPLVLRYDRSQLGVNDLVALCHRRFGSGEPCSAHVFQAVSGSGTTRKRYELCIGSNSCGGG